MRFHRLDLNLLVALDALLDERNTTRAAARLSVSQSAISGMLARLREYFEDPLLAPVGRQMELTPLGRELAEPVRNLLLQVQSTVAIRPGFDPASAQRHLRIMASDYVMQIFLGAFLRELKRHAPGITIEILPQSEDSAEKLRRGETDFLIIPQPFLAPDHPHQLLYEDVFVCVAWSGNAEVADGLDAEAFSRLGHAAPMLGKPRSPTLDGQHLAQLGIERRVEIVTPDFSSISIVITGTPLIGTMHRRLALLHKDRFALRVLPPPVPLPLIRECVQWHGHNEHDPAHRWVRQLMLAEAAALPAVDDGRSASA
jgi:LysR family nod box-dependent transcriptional activator